MVSLVDNKMGRVVDKKMKSKLADPIEVKEMEKKLKRKPPRAKIPKCVEVIARKEFYFTPDLDDEEIYDGDTWSEEVTDTIANWLDNKVKLPNQSTVKCTVELTWKDKTYVKERRAEVCDGKKGNYHKRR